jgi:hypothetical protein
MRPPASSDPIRFKRDDASPKTRERRAIALGAILVEEIVVAEIIVGISRGI